MDPKAKKSIFLGYKSGIKGYVLLDIFTREIFVSRNVLFYEHILPYPKSHLSVTSDWEYFPSQPPVLIPDSASSSSLEPPLPKDPPILPDSPSIEPQPISPPLRRSSRVSIAPSHLKNFICHASSQFSSPHTNVPLYPISNFLSFNKLSNPHCHFVLSISTNTEPKIYTEASKFDCWNQAMKTELTALERTRTWKLVDLPPNIKPIGYRWVYKIKHHADGSIERFKARLVAKGYNQIKGLDYFDTYSPVAKLTTIRLVLALASIHSWHLHQLDVNNALLHGDLQEDVYLTLPPGFKSEKPNQVCKLLKSLYGLKQASRKWYEKLTSLLVQNGYTQAASNHSLFTKTTSFSFTFLLVYVDDVILAGTSLSEFSFIKNILHTSFQIKDLGQLKYFLGLEVSHSKSGISICQRKYCLDLLSDTGFTDSKLVSTPSDPSSRLHHDAITPYHDIPSYRRLVGILLYLNSTRPDITHITQQLSQFLSNSTTAHHHAALRVLKYLKQSHGRGLFFPRDSSIHLLGFSDAD